MQKPDHPPSHGPHNEQIIANIKKLFHIEDTSGIVLFSTLQRIAHLSEILDCHPSDELDLSGPRWRLLLRLFAEEQMGKAEGLTPTVLSRSQRVSKNTISALLRGLEDQGLIQRVLDPKDLRVFRIQLTPAGRKLVMDTAPQRIEGLNQLLSGLNPEERIQLSALLEKLLHSLVTKVNTLKNETDGK